LEHILLHWVSHYKYIGIFILLLLGIVGVPIPDETLLALTGYLIFKGRLSMFPAFASAVSGSLCGITLSYLIGRSGGYYLIHTYGHKVGITPEKIAHAGRWLDRTGKWALAIGYFIPGIRHLTALTAGATRMKYHHFAVFAYSGGIVWSTLFILAGYFFEKGWNGTSTEIHRWALAASGAIICFLLVYYLVKRKNH
jgi:membrane protein DedA with SNARE-associated domain